MSIPLRPRLRPLEMIPVGPEKEPAIALHDPEELGQDVFMKIHHLQVMKLRK